MLLQEAEKYAEEESLLFLETSAKDSTNVSELFTMIARKLPLEQAANAQRRSTAGGSTTAGRQSAGGVDLNRGQGAGTQDACNC